MLIPTVHKTVTYARCCLDMNACHLDFGRLLFISIASTNMYPTTLCQFWCHCVTMEKIRIASGSYRPQHKRAHSKLSKNRNSTGKH